MFGSETDLGTYGTLAMETPEQEPQSRGAELDWQRTAMRGRFAAARQYSVQPEKRMFRQRKQSGIWKRCTFLI